MKKIQLNRVIILPVTKSRLEIGTHTICDDDFDHFFVQGLISTGEVIVKEDDDLTHRAPAIDVSAPVEKVYGKQFRVVEILPANKRKVVSVLTEAQKSLELKRRNK